MWRYFTQTYDTKWVKVLPDLMYNYNTTKHMSIGMTPQEASLEKNEAAVYKKLYPPEKVKVHKPKFQVGDHVRITIKRGDFRKGYSPNITRELFIITEVLNTKHITYRLKEFGGEVIEGSFYEEEMVKVKTVM